MLAIRSLKIPAKAGTWGAKRSFQTFFTKPLLTTECTPVVQKALEDATGVAIRYRQSYVKPESLMVAVIKQNQLTKEIFEQLHIEMEVVNAKLDNFMATLPKASKGSPFGFKWALASRIADHLQHDCFDPKGWHLNAIGPFMEIIKNFYDYNYRGSALQQWIEKPKYQLDEFLEDARIWKEGYKSHKIGEEHIWFAYSHEKTFGVNLFSDLGISRDELLQAIITLESRKANKAFYGKE